MADVFISYERQSQAIAQRLAARLTADGFKVWWDEQVPAHRPYAEVIEERLREARCVIVLWSRAAAKSQWVRAEAEIARVEGKLIQASVDATPPPLPFDQLQRTDLQGWKGDANHPGWRKIEASVRALLDARAAPVSAAPAARHRPVKPLWLGLGALAVLAALALGGWWVLAGTHPKASSGAAPRIAVLPLTTADAGLKAVAADIQDQIVSVLNTNGLTPLSGPAASNGAKAALLVDGRVETIGDKVRVSLRVSSGEDQAALWSGAFERPSAESAALPNQVATKLSDIVNCGVLTLARGVKMEDATRSLYLQSCDDSRDMDKADQVLDALRKVTRQAPDFAPALAELAMSGVLSIGSLPADQARSVRAEAEAAADRALKIDPTVADSYLAKSMLAARNNWLDRERWLTKGASRSSSGSIYAYSADLLGEVGRIDDALLFSRRALVLDPVSAPKTGALIAALLARGELTEAKSRLAQGERTWPGDPAMRMAAFDVAAFSDPAQGLRLLEDPGARPPGINDQGVAAWRSFVQARQSTAPAVRSQAAAALLQAHADHGLYWEMTARALLALGHPGEVAEDYRQRVAAGAGFDAAPLFSAQGAAMRRDPAFMVLAHDLGLTAYWRASGKWPDFCAEPGLPYKCQDLAR